MIKVYNNNFWIENDTAPPPRPLELQFICFGDVIRPLVLTLHLGSDSPTSLLTTSHHTQYNHHHCHPHHSHYPQHHHLTTSAAMIMVTMVVHDKPRVYDLPAHVRPAHVCHTLLVSRGPPALP